MQDTIVICLRYMMIAIGAATPSELSYLVSYRTEPTTKKCKTEKLKSKDGYAQK